MARRSPIDWPTGRTLFESGECATYKAVADALGCRRETVAARARREGWLSPGELLQRTAPQRAKCAAEEFIRRDAGRIVERLVRVASASELGLEVATRHLEQLRDEVVRICRRQGDVVVAEPPSLTLRRLGGALQSFAGVDRELAQLRDESWRAEAARAEGDPDAKAVDALLKRSVDRIRKNHQRELHEHGLDAERFYELVAERMRSHSCDSDSAHRWAMTVLLREQAQETARAEVAEQVRRETLEQVRTGRLTPLDTGKPVAPAVAPPEPRKPATQPRAEPEEPRLTGEDAAYYAALLELEEGL